MEDSVWTWPSTDFFSFWLSLLYFSCLVHPFQGLVPAGSAMCLPVWNPVPPALILSHQCQALSDPVSVQGRGDCCSVAGTVLGEDYWPKMATGRVWRCMEITFDTVAKWLSKRRSKITLNVSFQNTLDRILFKALGLFIFWMYFNLFNNLGCPLFFIGCFY